MYIDDHFYSTKYAQDIKARTNIRFLKGLYPRFISYIKNNYRIRMARKKGANIGKCVTIPYSLAKRANSNLTIGDHTSIQTDLIDLRCKVTIGSHTIIGSGVEIITLSHNIDTLDWEHKAYGISIGDYCWIATKAMILPSCRQIGNGAVCAAGSVVASNINTMSVIAGNPAKELRKRTVVHSDLCVESMLGNDLIAYYRAYTIK